MNRMKIAGIAVLLFCLLCTSAYAGEYVVLDGLLKGEEARKLNESGVFATVMFDGHSYVFDHDGLVFTCIANMNGGNTRSIHEYSMPIYNHGLKGDQPMLLGRIETERPMLGEMYVAVGDRDTGEYIVSGPYDLSNGYREDVFIQKDDAGLPLLVDRIYLYSVWKDGAEYYFALSLFVEYEGYAAAREPMTQAGAAEDIRLQTAQQSQKNTGSVYMPSAATPTPEPDALTEAATKAFCAASKPFGTDMCVRHIRYSEAAVLERTLGISGELLDLPGAGLLFVFDGSGERVAVFMDEALNVSRILDHQALLSLAEDVGLAVRSGSRPCGYEPASAQTDPILTAMDLLWRAADLKELPQSGAGESDTWYQLPANMVSALR